MTAYEKTSTDVTYPLTLPKGWSMISLPMSPNNPTLSEAFPDAVVVYEYQKGKGYVRVAREQTLATGKGYWVLFNDKKNYTLTGQPILEHNLSLNEDGWRMIGGCTHPAKASVDHGRIGVIYGYVQGIGYKRITSSEDIEPGEGYWILIDNIEEQAKLRIEIRVQ